MTEAPPISSLPQHPAAVKASNTRPHAQATKPEQKGDAAKVSQPSPEQAAEPKSSRQSGPSEFIYIPDLPQAAQLLPGVATSHTWLDVYVGWTFLTSPLTPMFFNEGAGLWLASLAVARRLVLPMPHGDIFPNLYVAWIAPSTLYAKSTSLALQRALALEVFPHLLAPQDTTPEALLDEMAGLEPKGLNELAQADQAIWFGGSRFSGQKGWILDEFSTLLATAGREYGAGLIGALLRFYDCDPLYSRRTRGSGLVMVRNSYLCFFGASTPAALRKHFLAEELWSNGWWPRFALLFPEGRPSWSRSVAVPRLPVLAEGLRALYDSLPEPTDGDRLDALAVEVGTGVLEAWEAYDKAMRCDLQSEELGCLAAYYGRLPTSALKIAMLLAALDWALASERVKTPAIELRHYYRAQTITETWRASAHRLLSAIAKSEMDAIEGRALSVVSKAGPQGITLRDIGRSMQDKGSIDVERAVGRLSRMGELEPFAYKQARGRPTTRYRIP